jgi:hypothetical protein
MNLIARYLFNRFVFGFAKFVTSSVRAQSITYTGDVNASLTQNAATNTNSPAQTQIQNLALGSNVINAPGGGTVPTALTVVPPAGNVTLITLKGIAGDTGIPLHKTDPTTISLDTSFVSLVLAAAGAVNGVRLSWS